MKNEQRSGPEGNEALEAYPRAASRRERWVIALLALTVFAFFAVLLSVQKVNLGPMFASPDDVYFHTRYAALLAGGEPSPTLPEDTSLSWFGGGSMYAGYHHLLALAIRAADAVDDDARLMVVSKVYHAALTGLVLAFFVVFAYRIARYFDTDIRTSAGLALLATVGLIGLFSFFFHRITYERPYLVSILVFLAIAEALLARSNVRLFLAGAVLPWFFSFFIIAYLPLVAYVLAGLLARKAQWWREVFEKGLVLTAGLMISILALPNTWFYLYNALFVHIISLYQAVGRYMAPSEIRVMRASVTSQILPGVTYAVPIVALIEWKPLRSTARNWPALYLTALAITLVPLYLLFARALDYLAPASILAFLAVSLCVYREHAAAIHAALRKHLTPMHRKGLMIPLVLIALMPGASFALWQPYDKLQQQHFPAMYEVLRANAEPGDKVFFVAFHLYTSAYFYAPHLRYANGIAPAFTYVSSRELFDLLQSMWAQESLVGCEAVASTIRCMDGVQAYNMLKKHNIRFVVGIAGPDVTEEHDDPYRLYQNAQDTPYRLLYTQELQLAEAVLSTTTPTLYLFEVI